MKKGISQEGLKLIACVTMLFDHIGYAIVYPLYYRALFPGSAASADSLYQLYLLFRCVGRLAFPVYCFLLTEGFRHTRNRRNYAIRLAVGAVLAEIPFDLVLSGEWFWPQDQSVMLTLLLGFFALMAMEKCKTIAWKGVVMLPFAIAAELLHTDYGWTGVILVALFEFSRYTGRKTFVQFCGMLVLFHYTPSAALWIGNVSIPMQALGALSVLFLMAYDGRKTTGSKLVQWAFYLFYPVHMLVLWLIGLSLI